MARDKTSLDTTWIKQGNDTEDFTLEPTDVEHQGTEPELMYRNLPITL